MKITIFLLLGLALCAGAADLRAGHPHHGAIGSNSCDCGDGTFTCACTGTEAPTEDNKDGDSGPGAKEDEGEAPTEDIKDEDDAKEDGGEDFEAEATAFEKPDMEKPEDGDHDHDEKPDMGKPKDGDNKPDDDKLAGTTGGDTDYTKLGVSRE